MLDKIKDLARRQDELLKRQRDLARERERMTAEELKRELEKLTREQSELRQRAEELAQQMAAAAGSTEFSKASQSSQGSQGSAGPQGRRATGPQSCRAQSGRRARRAPRVRRAAQGGQQMREASEEMRNAAGDLRRQDPAQASERGERALERLREVERQLAGVRTRRAAPCPRRSAARSASARGRAAPAGSGVGPRRAGRRRPGRAATAGRRAGSAGRAGAIAAAGARPAGCASRRRQGSAAGARAGEPRVRRQRVGERMQQSAEQMRAAAGRPAQTPPRSTHNRASRRRSQGADRQSAAANAARRGARSRQARRSPGERPTDRATNEATPRLSDQLGRAQELRERLDELHARSGTARQAEPARVAGSPVEAGRARQQGGDGGGGDASLERLREEYTRKLQETRELLDQMRRDDNDVARRRAGIHVRRPGHGALGAGHRGVQAGFREVGGAAQAGHAGARACRVVALEAAAGQSRRAIAWPPASTTSRRPATSSRSTATSRRWPRRRSHEQLDSQQSTVNSSRPAATSPVGCRTVLTDRCTSLLRSRSGSPCSWRRRSSVWRFSRTGGRSSRCPARSAACSSPCGRSLWGGDLLSLPAGGAHAALQRERNRRADSRRRLAQHAGRGCRRADAHRARRALCSSASCCPPCRRTFTPEIYAVGETVTPAAAGRPRADARRSDLSGALAAVAERYRGRRVSGIVLLSDGGDTSGCDRRVTKENSRVRRCSPSGSDRPTASTIARSSASPPAIPGSISPRSICTCRRSATASAARRFSCACSRTADCWTAGASSPAADGSPVDEMFTVSPDPLNPTVYTAEIAAGAGRNRRREQRPQRAREPGRPEAARAGDRRERPGYEHSFLTRALTVDPGLELDSVVRKGKNDNGQETFLVQAGAGPRRRP